MATPLDSDISDSSQVKPKGWVRSQIARAKDTVKDIKKDSSKMVKKTLTSFMRSAWKKQRELRILVTGKTGQGKSTLINGILGSKVATEGASATRCTTEVTVYSKTIEGVPIKVFDSPGLQDRTDNEEEYIRGMREQCQELSLVLYCTKMINTRLTDDDKNAMIKLTKAFGEKFWEFTVFVLTFANMENVERKDDRDDDEGPEPHMDDEEGWKELMKRRFEGRLKIWKEGLHQFLIKEVHVSPDIVVNIPIVPTGDNTPTRTNKYPLRLPDRENWFTKYWETCCLRVKETRLFLKINSGRIVSDDRRRADDKFDEEDSEDEDDVTAVDDVKTIDLSSLINFKARRSVFEPEFEPSQDQKNTLESPTPKTPPSPPPSNLKPKSDGTNTTLPPHQHKGAEPQQDFSGSLEDPRSQVLRSPTPPAHKELIDQSIHIHQTLVRDVTAVTMRRAGIQETIIRGAERVIDTMKKPTKWLTKLF